MKVEAGRVLVVGDTRTVEMLRGLTGIAGSQIDGCSGESEALRRLRRSGHDVVVTSRFTSMDEDLAFLQEARRLARASAPSSSYRRPSGPR